MKKKASPAPPRRKLLLEEEIGGSIRGELCLWRRNSLLETVGFFGKNVVFPCPFSFFW